MKTIQLFDEIYTAFIDLLERLELKQQPLSDLILIKTMINTIKPQGERDRSVIDWRKYPSEKPKAQMILVCADGAISTIFGNGLESFIRAGKKFVFWADIPNLPEYKEKE